MFGGRQGCSVFPMTKCWWLAWGVRGTGVAIGSECCGVSLGLGKKLGAALKLVTVKGLGPLV